MSTTMSKKEADYFRTQDLIDIHDGWSNLLAGLGKKQDKTIYSEVSYKAIITDSELTRVWYGEGMGKKIVTVVADDMTRAGFTVKGDEDDEINARLKALGFDSLVNFATYWARLYGGCLFVADIANSGELEEELPEGHGEVEGIRIYDRSMVQIRVNDVYGEESPLHGEPELFTVTPANQGVESVVQFEVHESRCSWFKGDPVPLNTSASPDLDRRFWGVSVLQAGMDDIAALGTTQQSLANVMMEMVIGKLKLGNLGEILAENNSKAFMDRTDIIAMQKSILNMILLGKDEEFSRDQVTLTNIPESIDRMYMRVQAVYNIPKTKLTGEQQSGLSNADNASLQNYYTDVEAKQVRDMAAGLSRICKWINDAEPVAGVDDQPKIEFNPVWEPPASERVKLLFDFAQAAEKLVQSGIIHPEEIRKCFSGDRVDYRIKALPEYDNELGEEPPPAQLPPPPAVKAEQNA